MPAGAAVLEVRADGFYPTTRQVALAPAGLPRESIELRPLPAQAAPPSATAQPSAPVRRDAAPGRHRREEVRERGFDLRRALLGKMDTPSG